MDYIKMYDSFTDGFDKKSKTSIRVLMILMCHLGENNMVVNEDGTEATIKEISIIINRSYGTTRKSIAELVKLKKLNCVCQICTHNKRRRVFQMNPEIAEVAHE